MRIEFVGNQDYSSDSVKLRLRLKEGRPLDPSLLDVDTETLYTFFESVSIEREDVPGGVVLRFRVKEQPIVRQLDINGLEGLKREDIEHLPIRTRVGYPLVARNLDLDRDDIAALYRRRGYHFGHVAGNPSVVVQKLEQGGVRVVFTVVEGPQVKVDEIVVRGNVHVSRKAILEAMQTKTSSLFSSNYFNEETLREDVVEIRRVLRAEGYLDAEAVLEDLRFSDDKSKVVVVVAVEEGELYTVGDVKFRIVREDGGKIVEGRQETGPGAMPPEDRAYFTQETLRSLLRLEPGQVYSGKDEDKGRDRIKEAYFERSYLEAAVEHAELLPRAGARVVDVAIEIREGLKFRVARVQLVGNELTRDKIILREIPSSPGRYIDRNALDRGLTRIRRLRYFERVSQHFADVNGPDGKPVPDVKDVVYELVEAKTGKLTIGAAVSGEGGLSANVQFQKRNFDIARPPRSWDDLTSGRAFTGAGQSFNVWLSPGTEISSFGVDFGEPRLFGSNFGLRVGAAKRIAFRERYREDITGYYVRLSHPLYETEDDRVSLEAFLTWKQEQRDISDVSEGAVPGAFLFEGARELRSLQAGLAYHRVDDPVRPSSRMTSTLSYESVGGPLGGELDYWKLDLNHDQRWRTHEDDEGKKQWLSLVVNAGVSHAYGDTPEVPPYSRYYAGGRGTLRGFAYREVGEHANGRPMGGEVILTGTLEYEIPIVVDLFGIVVFTDAGTIGTNINSNDAWQPRWSAGAGIRLKIPGFGDAPFAVDFALPIIIQSEDERQLVSFSLSRDF